MRLIATIFSTVLLISLAGVAWPADPFPGIDPCWVLLHEPEVIKELKLNQSQRQAFLRLMDGFDLRVFPLRNQKQETMLPELFKIFGEAKEGMKTVLKPAQEKRLNELFMRRLGTAGLLRDDLASKMKLTETQRQEIEKIVGETQTAVTALEKELSEGKPKDPIQKQYVALKTAEQRQVLKLLKPEQTATWRELVGAEFDTAKLGQPAYKAPELVDTGEWINSSPLRLESLRGKVAVIHFYACGCINCIHNYPWYRQWHEAFSDKGVVLIGIHTPETASERESAHVRRKAEDEKLAFPILIDGKLENWNAWGNSIWPSVYLVDKRGYLRQFWPGELNWQGANGEEYMRGWIEKLVAESSP